jgi:cytochrome c biogenesis factor
MLKVWNMLLVILTFSLSLFGTFLTRSGVLNSIHSFTEGSIGPWFLGFICFVVAGSLLLVSRACRCCARRPSSSRLPPARRRSSTTTCCS